MDEEGEAEMEEEEFEAEIEEMQDGEDGGEADGDD